MSQSPGTLLSTYLLNSESNDMGVDGSSTAVEFIYTVPASFSLLISRMLLYMESGSAFDSVKFMHLTALSEGVDIVIGGSTLTNWKDNVDVVLDMFDLSNPGSTFGKSTKVLAGRFSMWKLARNGCSLAAGQVFKAVVNDDLSAAGIIFRIKLQGELRPN